MTRGAAATLVTSQVQSRVKDGSAVLETSSAEPPQMVAVAVAGWAVSVPSQAVLVKGMHPPAGAVLVSV